MSMSASGFDGLAEELTAMAAKADGEAPNRALKAGAVPIERQMIHNAGADPKVITGALRSSIHTGRIKTSRDGAKSVTIGVHHGEAGAYYANPVEYGHGGPAPAPAHPFVRPAFDVRKDEAYDEIKRVLSDALK